LEAHPCYSFQQSVTGGEFGKEDPNAGPFVPSKGLTSEGAGPAQRNTALIDTPPAAAIVVPGAGEGTVANEGEDLTRIKGLGPKLSRVLADLGVTRLDQIAAWTEADIAAIDARLGAFAGRPVRDAWVEQAQLLIAGDAAAYEAKFGKL
jgi:predicted flap endonuclease-1-like 5' DNA nuclease